ncbi:MAG: AAA family ATPase [Proteobacteria bacterium]|nr:AAA family ATPase [Pseudomonadota bacterium]
MAREKKDHTTIIAVCGKGGVGKTSISAMITKIVSEDPSLKILSIDADPATGLATSLGFNAERTVDDIRNDLIQRVEQGLSGDKQEIVTQLDYEVFEAIREKGNIAFLAIGRPEKDGCYCQVNHILKDIIASIASHFDFVIIDGEAGIEQVNRRVMEKVTHLVLVSDASKKGLNVVASIKDVSDQAIQYEQAGLVLNRIRDKKEQEALNIPPSLKLVGWLPEDEVIRKFDIEGKSILDMPGSIAQSALKNALRVMGLSV